MFSKKKTCIMGTGQTTSLQIYRSAKSKAINSRYQWQMAKRSSWTTVDNHLTMQTRNILIMTSTISCQQVYANTEQGQVFVSEVFQQILTLTCSIEILFIASALLIIQLSSDEFFAWIHWNLFFKMTNDSAKHSFEIFLWCCCPF